MKINRWVALGFTLVVIEKGIKAGYDFYTHNYYSVSWSLAIIVYCIYEMEKYHIEINEQAQQKGVSRWNSFENTIKKTLQECLFENTL